MVEIQKANPQARRNAIINVIIGALVGVGLFFLLEYLVGNVNLWIQSHAVYLIEHHYIAFLAMVLLVSPVLWLTVYLIRFTKQIIRTERFPPPDTPVIRNVRMLEGKAAIRRGRLLQVLCWLILIPTATLPLLVWYIFYSIRCVS